MMELDPAGLDNTVDKKQCLSLTARQSADEAIGMPVVKY